MTELRLKGQDVVVRLAVGRELQNTFTAVSDFTFQYDMATTSEGYIGEKTMRKDDIFNGVSGSFTITAEGQELLEFIDFLRRRAQRDPDIDLNESMVNATARMTFPNGQTPKVLVRDMKFGAIPVAVPARDAYVTASFTYEAPTAKIITT